MFHPSSLRRRLLKRAIHVVWNQESFRAFSNQHMTRKGETTQIFSIKRRYLHRDIPRFYHTKWVRRSVCLGVKESVAAGRISGSSSRPSRNARIGQSVALNWMECLIVRWACLVYGNSSWMTSDKNDIVVVDDLQVHFCANNDDSFLALHTCIHCWSWARTISMFVCIMNEEDTKISVWKQPRSIDDSFGYVMVLLVDWTSRSSRSRPCSIIL